MIYFSGAITRSHGQIFIFAQPQNIHQFGTCIYFDPAPPTNSIPYSRDNGFRFTAANFM